MTLGLGFYSQNSGRRYPLDDSASAESDDGAQLPSNILVDAYLKFPSTYGRYAFISSLISSEGLISLTLLGSNRPAIGETGSSEDVADFIPLASISVPRAELQQFQQYLLTPLQPGVGGWVVFGACRKFSGFFSTVQQSMLLPQVCHAYDPLPIPEVSKLYNVESLVGVVGLIGANDLTITRQQRYINGAMRDAIVFALQDAPGRNVLDLYRGPCSGRPESYTCLQPGIEDINGFVPDCRGNIDLEVVSDCADLVVTDHNTLLVDYCLGLADACRAARLPRDGKLPNDHDDQCDATQWTEETVNGELRYFHGFSGGGGSSSQACVELPFVEEFEDESGYFDVERGELSVRNGALENRGAGLGLVSWNGCGQQESLAAGLHVNFVLATTDGRGLAGVVFDLRADGSFYSIEASKYDASLRLRYYTGTNFVLLGRVTGVPLNYDLTYGFNVSVSGQTVTCRLLKHGYSGDSVAILSAEIPRLADDAGRLGLLAAESHVRFTKFVVGDAPADSSSTSPGSSSYVPCNLPLESLWGYWPLGQVGVQRDLAGILDLTPTSTLEAVDGLYGRDGSRIAAGQQLTSVASDAITVGAAFTVSFWVKFRSRPTAQTMVLGKYSGTAWDWAIWADSAGLHATFTNTAGRQFRVSPKNAEFGQLPLNEWIHVTAWVDTTVSRLYMRLNNAFSGFSSFSGVGAGTELPLAVGVPLTQFAGVLEVDLDELVLFSTVLTEDQLACLMNDGLEASGFSSSSS